MYWTGCSEGSVSVCQCVMYWTGCSEGSVSMCQCIKWLDWNRPAANGRCCELYAIPNSGFTQFAGHFKRVPGGVSTNLSRETLNHRVIWHNSGGRTLSALYYTHVLILNGRKPRDKYLRKSRLLWHTASGVFTFCMVIAPKHSLFV